MPDPQKYLGHYTVTPSLSNLQLSRLKVYLAMREAVQPLFSGCILTTREQP